MAMNKNHGFLMFLCCAIPIIILIAVSFFGLSQQYIYWLVILLCPLMHYFMMNNMHNKDGKDGRCH